MTYTIDQNDLTILFTLIYFNNTYMDNTSV